MQISSATAPPATRTPDTRNASGPTLPAVRRREIEFEWSPDRTPTPGWVTPNDRPWVHGGTVVSEQLPDRSTIAVSVRTWGNFYGASARLNVALGHVVQGLDPTMSDADAIAAARELSGESGSVSLAVVRRGRQLLLTEVLTPDARSPYARGMNASGPDRWDTFRVDSNRRSNPGMLVTGDLDELRFTDASVRAIVDGANLLRNPVPAQHT